MAKQALIDAINETLAPYVHPDDLKPSHLSLSLWSGSVRFPRGIRLNVDAINKELAKSSAESGGDRGDGTVRASQPAPFLSPQNHRRRGGCAAGGSKKRGRVSDPGPGAPTTCATDRGGGVSGWSPFRGWSSSQQQQQQRDHGSRRGGDSARRGSVRRQQQPKTSIGAGVGSHWGMSVGATTLGSQFVNDDSGGGRSGCNDTSFTVPSSYLRESWAVNVNLDAYRNETGQQYNRTKSSSSSWSDSNSDNPFLAGLGLPSNVRLVSGFIRQVQIDIPWSSLTSKPVVVKLSGVRLAISPAEGQGQTVSGAGQQQYGRGYERQAPSSSSGGGGLFRSRGREAVLRNRRAKEEQAVADRRRRIVRERETRRRKADAFLRCLFADRTEGRDTGRDDDSADISMASVRSSATGSGGDGVVQAHTSTTTPVKRHRSSLVYGGDSDDDDDDDDDVDGDFGIDGGGSSFARSNGSRLAANRSQSPYLRPPTSNASGSRRTKRQRMNPEVFRSRLRRKIMENLHLEVKGIHLQFVKPRAEDEGLSKGGSPLQYETKSGTSADRKGFVLGILLDSLSLYSTDEHGRRDRRRGRSSTMNRPSFMKSSTSGMGLDATGTGGSVGAGSTFLFKALRVNGFGIYLEEGKNRADLDAESLFSSGTVSSRDNLSEDDLPSRSFQRRGSYNDDCSIASFDTDAIDDVLSGGYGRRYVVNPVSFEAAYRQRNDDIPTIQSSSSGASLASIQSIHRRQAEAGSGNDETEHLLFSQIPHLSIVLSESQFHLAAHVVDSFAPQGYQRNFIPSSSLRPLYPEYRPSCSITSLTALDWWEYAIRSVRRRRRPGLWLWRDFFDALRTKRIYVALYKRYIAHSSPNDKSFYDAGTATSHRCSGSCCKLYEPLTPTDIESMRTLEDNRLIAIEALVRWRAEVEAELWRERQSSKRGSGKPKLERSGSMSRLSTVFQAGLSFGRGEGDDIEVDDLDPSGNESEETLALTADDLDRLELQLELFADALSRTSSPRVVELELSLGFVVLDLVSSSDLSQMAKLRIGAIDLAYTLSSSADSALSLSLSSILVEDMTTFDPAFHSVLRSVHHSSASGDDDRSQASGHASIGTSGTPSGDSACGPCPAATFSLNMTRDKSIEVVVAMTTFEFVLSSPFFSCIQNFLRANDETSCVNAPALHLCVKDVSVAVMDRIVRLAQQVWDEKCRQQRRWDFDISVEPLIFVLPGDRVDPHSRAAVFSLGHQHFTTVSSDKEMNSTVSKWLKGQHHRSKSERGMCTPDDNYASPPLVMDRWGLKVSGMAVAIGPSNDESWRQNVLEELIHAGVARDVLPWLILQPIAIEVDVGTSAHLVDGSVKHRRSWAEVNFVTPTVKVCVKPDDLATLVLNTRQWRESVVALQRDWPSLSPYFMHRPPLASCPLKHDPLEVATSDSQEDSIFSSDSPPTSIFSGRESSEQPSTHILHISCALSRMTISLKVPREGMFNTHLDSVSLSLSSNTSGTTRGRFQLENFWIFHQFEEAQPTLLVGNQRPGMTSSTSDRMEAFREMAQPGEKDRNHEGDLIDILLTITNSSSSSNNNNKAHTPLDKIVSTCHVGVSGVSFHWYPRIMLVLYKSCSKFARRVCSASYPEDDIAATGTYTRTGVSYMSNWPGPGTEADDESSTSSVSTANSLLDSTNASGSLIERLFPAVWIVKRALLRPTPGVTMETSLRISSVDFSMHPEEGYERRSFLFSSKKNAIDIAVLEDCERSVSVDVASISLTCSSSYTFKKEYHTLIQGGSDDTSCFVLKHSSCASSMDEETGKFKPRIQTSICTAPVQCVYLHTQVAAIFAFSNKSGLQAALSLNLPLYKRLFLADTFEQTVDWNLGEVSVAIPESCTSTSKFTAKVGSTSIHFASIPSGNEVNEIELNNIMLCCENDNMMTKPASVSVEIIISSLDRDNEDDEEKAKKIQICTSEIHFHTTSAQYRQIMVTICNNFGTESIKTIGDIDRPQVSRGNSSKSSVYSGISAEAGSAEDTNRLTEVEISAIIPVVSLTLCGEDGIDDPMIYIRAEKAGVLIKYTAAVPKPCFQFGVQHLGIDDMRESTAQVERQILRQLFEEKANKQAISIDYQEKHDGSLFNAVAKLGTWQLNLKPELMDIIQAFSRSDSSSQGLGIVLAHLFPPANEICGDNNERKGEKEEEKHGKKSPLSTLEFKTSTLKIALFEDDAPREKSMRPARCVSIQYRIDMNCCINMWDGTAKGFEAQTNIDCIQMFTAEGAALANPVQILDPTSVSLYASSVQEQTLSGLTCKAIVMTPIDLTISTRDVLLMQMLLSRAQTFLEAAVESLPDSFNFLNASTTSTGLGTWNAAIPQSTSDVPREIDISSSVSRTVEASLMIPSSTIVLVNDSADLLPRPLFKFVVENIFFKGQADEIKEAVSSSLLSTLRPSSCQSRLSLRAEVYDSCVYRWKMSSRCDVGINFRRQKESRLIDEEHAKRLDIELHPCEIVLSPQLFDSFSLLVPFLQKAKANAISADIVGEGTRVVPNGPYGFRNYTGFDVSFSLGGQAQCHQCEAGKTKYFMYQHKRSSGSGYCRTYGQDWKDAKGISVFEQVDGATESDSQLLSLSIEDIDAELDTCRAHKYGGGRIVFSEVIAEEGKMILVLRARVLLHNITHFDVDVGMKVGDYLQDCCSCSAQSLGADSSQPGGTVALGIPRSARSAFDTAAEKTSSKLALQLRINGTDTQLMGSGGLVGVLELPSVPDLSEMTVNGSVTEIKDMSFHKDGGASAVDEAVLCASMTFVSTVIDGHPSVDVYLHPKAIICNKFPTSLYFGITPQDKETADLPLQIGPGDSVQLFTPSQTALLRVQTEFVEETCAGGVKVATSWSEADTKRLKSRARILGKLLVRNSSGIVEALLSETKWEAGNGEFVPPTRLLTLEPRNILVDHSNCFSIECSDHAGSLELPSFLLNGVLTTPLPKADKDLRIVLRDGTSGRSLILQTKSVPYGKGAIEASPLPLAGKAGSFSGYYAFKKSLNLSSKAHEYHVINGYHLINNTQVDLICLEASSEDHQCTLHPGASASISWNTIKEGGITLSLKHQGASFSTKLTVNTVGERLYDLKNEDSLSSRVSVRVNVLPGGPEARLQVKVHSFIVDGAERVASMPPNDFEIAHNRRGGGICIIRVRVPQLQVMQTCEKSQELALFAVDHFDMEYCKDSTTSKRSGVDVDGPVILSCALISARGLRVEDLRGRTPTSVINCISSNAPNGDFVRLKVDIHKVLQSDDQQYDAILSFPKSDKRSPLEVVSSADFVDSLCNEWRHCLSQVFSDECIRLQKPVLLKKIILEPFHLSLTLKPRSSSQCDKVVETRSSLIYYIPSALLDTVANGEEITAKIRLSEVAIGDTTLDPRTLLHVLQVVYAIEIKSYISAEFSEATQSDLLSDLRQRREICQLYSVAAKERQDLFADGANAFNERLIIFGCMSAQKGVNSYVAETSKGESAEIVETKAVARTEDDVKPRGWFGFK